MKQKKQLWWLGGLVLVAAAIWYYELTPTVVLTKAFASTGSVSLLTVDNPALHWDELHRAQKTEYKSAGRNPFSLVALPPEPVAGIAQVAQKTRDPYGPRPPAPEPPLQPPPNLKFFGYGTVPNGSPRRAFFADGDNVLIVAEGETFMGRFRILRINNTNLEFEELSTGKKATMPLVEDQAAAIQAPTPPTLPGQ
jgi:hypothetical protein